MFAFRLHLHAEELLPHSSPEAIHQLPVINADYISLVEPCVCQPIQRSFKQEHFFISLISMSYCIPVIEFHQQIHWNDWTKALLLREMSPLEDFRCTHLKKPGCRNMSRPQSSCLLNHTYWRKTADWGELLLRSATCYAIAANSLSLHDCQALEQSWNAYVYPLCTDLFHVLPKPWTFGL